MQINFFSFSELVLQDNEGEPTQADVAMTTIGVLTNNMFFE